MTREEFELLIEKYLRGEATPSEERLINAFMDGQPAGQEDGTVPSEEMWQTIESRLREESHARKGFARYKQPLIKVAISITLLLVAGFGFHQFKTKQRQEWISSEAPFGEKRIVTLNDGTVVYLNSGSKISFPREFAKSVRQIRLEGEAFFEVARNVNHPFEVKTGNVTTKVLGTSFNISAFSRQQVRITVATGRVMVRAQLSDSAVDSVKEMILNPNQQAVFKDRKWITSEDDLSTSLAWKNNTLRFDETTLSDAATSLERWYNVSIKFENDAILQCRINGQFKDQSLQNVLKSIQYMYNIDFKYSTQNQIILYGKGCTN